MIKVLQAGLHSSFQDMGRFLMTNYAVPQSGVMDEYNAKQANLLLQNDMDAPVLEIALQGPKLQFQVNTYIVCTGIKAKVLLNESQMPLHQVVSIKSGDILHLPYVEEGNYAYIAIQHGFEVSKVFDSVSYYKGITPDLILKKGDVIKVITKDVIDDQIHSSTLSHLKLDEHFFSSPFIDVYHGPEFQNLTDEQQKLIIERSFHISKECNRMAFQLEEVFENSLSSILTSTVIPGTVQLTPNGKLIVLMKDAQTTGGYPRVLQLSSRSISKMAQKRAGEEVRFRLSE